ncbi:MAG TPA: gamma-glutamyltransferase, partial [Terrimicrobiaceae bacterium]
LLRATCHFVHIQGTIAPTTAKRRKPSALSMELFHSRRAPIYATHGIVASSQPLAAQVGLQVLTEGGHAVDAALAMAATANVTEPMMNGLGGDAFVMIFWRGKLYGLNASGRCGQAMTREALRKTGWKHMPQAGWGSVSVPGAPDGYLALHERFGSKRFADLVEPAACYAEEGIAVGQKAAQFWRWSASKLLLSEQSTQEYLIDGRPPKPGEIFRQPNLARTWRTLAKHGREAFYEGELAQKIVAASDAGGGYLQASDLAAQHCEWVEPISTDYRGYRVMEMPPNGQGLIVLLALRILAGFDVAALSRSDPAVADHLILESLKLSFADAERYVGDPRFQEVDVNGLLSEAFIASRRKRIQLNKALPAPTAGSLRGNTTYFTLVDKDRNAVSFITSLSDMFGSGMVARDTGILLHNRAAAFSLEPGHPNEVNSGKRPRHSILPAMIFEGHDLRLTLGCVGANMQPQGQVQILLNLIDRGMNLQEAVDAPRVRALGGLRISVEQTCADELVARLASMGHDIVSGDETPADWIQPHEFARSFKGSAQAVAIDRNLGTLCGASDPRLDGVAIGY